MGSVLYQTMCENLTVKYYNRKFTVPVNVTEAKYSKATMRLIFKKCTSCYVFVFNTETNF